MLIFTRKLSDILAVPENIEGAAAANEMIVAAYVGAARLYGNPGVGVPPIVLDIETGVCVDGFSRIAAAMKLELDEMKFVDQNDVPAHRVYHGVPKEHPQHASQIL